MLTFKFQVGSFEFGFETNALFSHHPLFETEKELMKWWKISRDKMEAKMKDPSNVMIVGDKTYFLPQNDADEDLENEWNLIDRMRRTYLEEVDRRHTIIHERRLRFSDMNMVKFIDDKAEHEPREDSVTMPTSILKFTSTTRFEPDTSLIREEVCNDPHSTSTRKHLITFNIGNNYHAIESDLVLQDTHYSFEDTDDLKHKRELKMHIWKYKMEQKNIKATKSGREEDRYWTEDDFELERELWIFEEIISTFMERNRAMVATQLHRRMRKAKKQRTMSAIERIKAIAFESKREANFEF